MRCPIHQKPSFRKFCKELSGVIAGMVGVMEEIPDNASGVSGMTKG
jgi:hypothetical protein